MDWKIIAAALFLIAEITFMVVFLIEEVKVWKRVKNINDKVDLMFTRWGNNEKYKVDELDLS